MCFGTSLWDKLGQSTFAMESSPCFSGKVELCVSCAWVTSNMWSRSLLHNLMGSFKVPTLYLSQVHRSPGQPGSRRLFRDSEGEYRMCLCTRGGKCAPDWLLWSPTELPVLSGKILLFHGEAISMYHLTCLHSFLSFWQFAALTDSNALLAAMYSFLFQQHPQAFSNKFRTNYCRVIHIPPNRMIRIKQN